MLGYYKTTSDFWSGCACTALGAPMMKTVEIERGSVPHTVLLYTVSEPGDWTASSIADDLPGSDPAALKRAAKRLHSAGLIHINSADLRLWPRRSAKGHI
jgi:hypothetical protein